MLRINYILPRSGANGPGTRYTLWVQGCSIHCPGCSNQDTWDPKGGYSVSVDDMASEILGQKDIDGVTITGGEPLDQFDATYSLCSKLFGKISIFLTTGYTVGQLIWLKYDINSVVDILCTGPFREKQICSGSWKGSSNQEIRFLTDLGKKQSKMPVVLKEFHIRPNGSVMETGFST